VQCPYGQRFIDTLVQCLTYFPFQRINVETLVTVCVQHVNNYDEDNPAGDNASASSGSSGTGLAPAEPPTDPPEPPTDPPKPPPSGPESNTAPSSNNDNALSGPNIPPPSWKLQVAPNPMPKFQKPFDPEGGIFINDSSIPVSPDAGDYVLLFPPGAKPTESKKTDFAFQLLEEIPPAERVKEAKARAAGNDAASDAIDKSPTIYSPSGIRRNPPEFKDLPVPSSRRRRGPAAPPEGRSPTPDDKITVRCFETKLTAS
jgi:hypothetical protein